MSRDQQHRAIAFLVEAIRPDWGAPGVMAALDKLRDRPLADVTVAAMRAAMRDDQRTPAVIALSGPHWLNPQQAPTTVPPSFRSSTHCGICSRDRSGHERINSLDPESAHQWATRAELDAIPRRVVGDE